jgi:hypothetical protein
MAVVSSSSLTNAVERPQRGQTTVYNPLSATGFEWVRFLTAILPVDIYTASAVLTGEEDCVIGNSTTAITLTLPSTPDTGTHIMIKNNGIGLLTVSGNGRLIDNEEFYILEQYDAFELTYNGTNWSIF